jgi:hypothetical protein
MKNNYLSHIDYDYQGMRGKFTIPSFVGFYDGEKYLNWKMAVDKKFSSHLVLEKHKVKHATSEFKDFAIVWWYGLAPQDALPSTWEELKVVMRDRFIPPSYKRDMHNKLQRLEQDNMSTQEYYAVFRRCRICCGIVEVLKDEIVRFYGGLRREIQDIVFHKEFYSVNRLFELAILAEKELQQHQQRNWSNIGDNLTTQIIARVEQAFDTTAAPSSPPPPTPAQESAKTMIHAEIIQPDRESTTNENKEIDIKFENHHVLNLKDSFMLATKSDIAEISDDVLNLSPTHGIIEQHLVDTKSEFPLSQNNCSDSGCDKEELCDNASIIYVSQLLSEIDTLVWKRNTCAKNKQLLPIATRQDELKLLSSFNTLGYIEFDTLCALSSLEEKFKCAEFPWLTSCTYRFIGKYNCKGEYMLHRIYICSNLKSPFSVQQYEQLEDCNRYNHVMSRSPCFVLKKQVKFKEEEQS